MTSIMMRVDDDDRQTISVQLFLDMFDQLSQITASANRLLVENLLHKAKNEFGFGYQASKSLLNGPPPTLSVAIRSPIFPDTNSVVRQE